MRNAIPRAVATAFLLTILLLGSPELQGQYSRQTPVVEAVRKTRPSIVAIKAEKKASTATSKGTVGTGVIVDERGYVVTSSHVIAEADTVTVELAEGTRLTARVVVDDKEHDLAVLHIRAEKKLPALPLGPAGDLMVGETVIAVGHPFGYNHTVSTGIISALGREVSMPGGIRLTQMIQTSASINPGNSGGPLLNINGEVIGINSAIRDGAQGIAFAMSADTVQRNLSKHLSVHQLAGLRHGLVCGERISGESGNRQRVVVEAVADKSPAQGAGLEQGDAILLLGGRAISNRFDLERAMWDFKAGDKIDVKIVRRSREMTISLSLMELAEKGPPATARSGHVFEADRTRSVGVTGSRIRP